MFLFPVAGFLFPVALLFFPIARLLFPVAFFLLLVLTLVFHIAGFVIAIDFRRCRALRGSSLRCTAKRPAGCRSPLREARRGQQKHHDNPSLVSHTCCIFPVHIFLPFSFAPAGAAGVRPDSPRCCSSFPTTRTLNKIPRSSMRCRIPSSCAVVGCCGLCATSSSVRSNSSSTPASAVRSEERRVGKEC